MSTPLPTAPNQSTPIPASIRGRFRRAIRVSLVIACATGGAAGSLAFQTNRNPTATTAKPDEPVSPGIAPPNGEPVPNLVGAPFAARIDTLIRAGCYADALAACREAPRTTFGADECPLAYREALSLEGLGKWKDADAAFKKAEGDTNAGAWARAILGRARCAVAQDSFPAAWVFLNRVLLRTGHPECRGTKVYEEALSIRARLAVLEAGAVPALGPLNADALAWPSLRVSADQYLDWLPTDSATGSPASGAVGEVVEVHHNVESHGTPEVTVRLSSRPAIDVLRAVAAAAGLEIRADNNASTFLTATVGPVEVERLPLGELLGSLTERDGIAWTIQSGTLQLTHAPRVTEPDATADLLRRVLAIAPEHPATAATRVTLANLDAHAGRIRSAARGYKQVIEIRSSRPEATHAAYNLGLLELKEGNRASARSRFLEVIDRAPGTHWADLGWCWVARTHLDGGDTVSARSAYRTALNGNTKEALSAAALGVCTCDLLDGSDESARSLLRDTRLSVRESHAMLGTFYESLLRYRGAPTESRRELLLTAIEGSNHGRAFGPAGVYFVGRVYAELGLAQQMCDLYDTAINDARGPFALRMTFTAAARYDHLDMRKQARTRYAALAAADPDTFGAQSELRLAALDAREGNGAEAVRRCRSLLNRAGVERTEVLAVMGHGYELQKKFGHAAECFAGRVPGK